MIIGIGILNSLSSSKVDTHPVENAVKNSNYPACSEFENFESIGKEGFRTLIYGRYFQTCEKYSNNITTVFKLKEEDIETMVNDMTVSPKILYRENCKYIEGFNGIIVEESGTNVISDFGDNLTIKRKRPVLVCQN